MAKLKQIELAFDFSAPIEEEILEQKTIAPIQEATTSVEEITAPIDETVATIVEEPILEPTIQQLEQPKAKNSLRGRKSIKAMEAEADLIEVPDDEQLFSKLYYTMSEVTGMFKVNHSLIRFWESEFDILQPRKNKKGDRLFKPEDVKNLNIIYHLLRVKKYTIEGAKDYFKNTKKLHLQFEAVQKLENLKSFLLEIKANLG